MSSAGGISGRRIAISSRTGHEAATFRAAITSFPWRRRRRRRAMTPPGQRRIDPRRQREGDWQIFQPPHRHIGEGLRLHRVDRPAERGGVLDPARQPPAQFAHQGRVPRAAAADDGDGRLLRHMGERAGERRRGEGGERRRGVLRRELAVAAAEKALRSSDFGAAIAKKGWTAAPRQPPRPRFRRPRRRRRGRAPRRCAPASDRRSARCRARRRRRSVRRPAQ